MTRVTEATDDDIPVLCELLEVLFSQESEFAPDRAAQERGLALIIGHPDAGRILVVREGGRVAGMANLLFTVSTALGARVALLEDVVVRPQLRSHGLGSELVEAAIACAVKNGCKRITLLTDRDNETAQKFYKRHGFAASSMLPMRLFV